MSIPVYSAEVFGGLEQIARVGKGSQQPVGQRLEEGIAAGTKCLAVAEILG
jgi:hypothetical protein